MAILWLIVLTATSSWLGFTLTLNPVLGAELRRREAQTSGEDRPPIGRNLNYAVLMSSTLAMTALAIILSFVLSIKPTLIAMSFVAYSLSLLAFYILQRFAGPFRRSYMVSSYPAIYPTIIVICLLSFVSSTIAFGLWFLSFLSIVAWFMFGFMSAEASIRQYMTHLGKSGKAPDRRAAIFSINQNQGRNSLFSGDRYPFP